MLVEAVTWKFFKYRGNVFPDFRTSKSKSGSSIIIAYPWPMKIKVGNLCCNYEPQRLR